MPERIQLRRVKGWRMPANTLKVDRSTKWGNPFYAHGDGIRMDRALAVRLFERHLEQCGGYTNGKKPSVTLLQIRRELAGKNLACWCPLPKVG